MPFCPFYQSDAIRADYSRHFLRACLQGFRPLTFHQFCERFARRFYLTGTAGAMPV